MRVCGTRVCTAPAPPGHQEGKRTGDPPAVHTRPGAGVLNRLSSPKAWAQPAGNSWQHREVRDPVQGCRAPEPRSACSWARPGLASGSGPAVPCLEERPRAGSTGAGLSESGSGLGRVPETRDTGTQAHGGTWKLARGSRLPEERSRVPGCLTWLLWGGISCGDMVSGSHSLPDQEPLKGDESLGLSQESAPWRVRPQSPVPPWRSHWCPVCVRVQALARSLLCRLLSQPKPQAAQPHSPL